MSMRRTTEDAHFKDILIPTLIALLIAGVLLVLTYLWLFKHLLG